VKDIDAIVDEIYKAPLEEFTRQRNAAAKDLSGAAKQQIKTLLKPSAPVWAVNQLFWRDRAVYNALVDASEKLRAAHRALLSGRKTDIQKPEQVHKAALERAIAKTTAIANSAEGRVSEPTLETIRKTLAALPTDERAGRMTRPPEPVGFSLLAGIKPRAIKPSKEEKKVAAPPPAPPPPPEPPKKVRAAERELEKARKAAEAARAKLAAAEDKLRKLTH